MDVRTSNMRRHLDSRHPESKVKTVSELVAEYEALLTRGASQVEIINALGLNASVPPQRPDPVQSHHSDTPKVEPTRFRTSDPIGILSAILRMESVAVDDISAAINRVKELQNIVIGDPVISSTAKNTPFLSPELERAFNQEMTHGRDALDYLGRH